ncbi:allergin-1 isoform X7 [Anolis carolinensis]|uniref:allergin-1 isoform X7 n=1 Tax=Anolis carolinensis TaxID=28377 RepID=UPI0007DB8276|nr:PREDICTED: allergin-1 isoform X6 [Anolis carolinensis]|eukprot:XP_016851242.1 PREDICTED: allergin-1 isoform X6 [Anolis carolinensis]
MPKCLSIVCLLLASFHSCLQNMQSHDGEKGTSEIAISCLKDLQDLEIYSPFSEIAIGKNVTLECRSQKGCLPINYTLYLNTTKMQHTIQRKAEEKVVFNITINSISDVGEYKCKAQNNGSKYSPGFTFTLRDEPKDVLSCSDPVNKVEISSPVSEIVLAPEEEKNKLIVYIIAPLLLLFLLTVIAVAIPLIILPWCKAKNQKSARTSTHFTPVGYFNSETATYDAVGKVGTIYSFVIKSDGKGEEVVYCNVKTETMERECRKGTLKEDSTVNYAEIVIRR